MDKRKFIIIRGDNLQQLENEVNNASELGFKPVGSITNFGEYYFQGVFKD